MKQGRCIFEEKTERASRSGHWSDELLAHVAGCHACEEVALVTSYLSASSHAVATDAELPDAGRIWWKAQLSAKTAAMERALRPIVWARRFAFCAFAAAAVAAILLWWPNVARLGGGLVEMWRRRNATAPAGHDSFLLLATTMFLVILIPLVVSLYEVWSEN